MQRQEELARLYLLVDKRSQAPDARQSFAYDLLDTRPANIEAIVRDPEVADTNDVDRDQFRIRAVADHGAGWTWVAYRTPGLRDQTVRWIVLVTLIVTALVGLHGVVVFWLGPVSWPSRRWLRSLDDRGDVFDRIDRSRASGRACCVCEEADRLRVCHRGPLVRPLSPPGRRCSWPVCGLALVFAVPIRGWRRLAIAGVAVLAILEVKDVLPRADLAEAHNAFLVLHDGEALERGLPPAVFRSWRARFDALYPASKETPSDFSWRTRAPVPGRLFTTSSDAIWRQAKYTRQVDAVSFHTLGEFRGGFANENEYNFWVGSVRREQMPFYVMYELTPSSVGSAFAWRGQVFWERPDGGFDEVVHSNVATRPITADDAGRRVYAAFFPERDQIDFRFEPSATLRLSAIARSALTLLGTVRNSTSDDARAKGTVPARPRAVLHRIRPWS
jgi:hypothetical protein